MLFDPGCSNCGCPPPGTAYRVRPTSCGQPLPAGVLVRLWTNSGMTVLRGEALTDSAGLATFYLTSAGTAYAYVPTPPSSRIAPGGGNVTLHPVNPQSFVLQPASGYTCCYSSCGGGHSGYVPRGRLRATTSGGATWTFEGCTWQGCVDSDLIPLAGAPKTVRLDHPTDPTQHCEYYTRPDDWTMGRLTCGVRIERNSANGNWIVGIAAPPGGNGYGRPDPEPTYWQCAAPGTYPSTYQYGETWYAPSTAGSCTGPFAPHSGFAAPTSCDPLVATINLWGPMTAFERTSLTGSGSPIPGRPSPIKTITITEE